MDSQIAQADALNSSSSTCNCSSSYDQFLDKCSNSRRSVDWRDSGIVIDDDYPFQQFEIACDLHRSTTINVDHRETQQPAADSESAGSLGASQSTVAQEYCDDDGDTLLHLAVVGCAPDKVEDLIKSSTYNLNAVNNMLHTPMHVASMANRPEVVGLLLSSGADPTIQDRRGNSPLHKACEKGYNEVVCIVLDHLRGTIDPESFSHYLELTNFDGQTCLHLAASNDKRDTLDILINRYGADLNCHDSKSGETIMHKAVQKVNLELVKFILNLDKHCNEPDYSYRMPIDTLEFIRDTSRMDQSQLQVLSEIHDLVRRREESCKLQRGSCCSRVGMFGKRKPISERLDSTSSMSSMSSSSDEYSGSEMED